MKKLTIVKSLVVAGGVVAVGAAIAVIAIKVSERSFDYEAFFKEIEAGIRKKTDTQKTGKGSDFYTSSDTSDGLKTKLGIVDLKAPNPDYTFTISVATSSDNSVFFIVNIINDNVAKFTRDVIILFDGGTTATTTNTP
ncbi:hypothetical protein [Mycoplasmopsis agassizii]|uniref:DUF1310 family protein n=1 Tax=Mycoplasmopsis agassizii TaxID=33922 RepID=A0ABX4H5K0_9BACT|nr:hypothetical protein [Mycoplasmopsis agassizii]PAF55177.1 hypothetical protein CJF60_00625 [Mycoplasmopsis agassizii]SMC16880.1 hypothetical protein SAMN02745179_00348 [Mycoplasmopsis agassizii]